MITFRSLLSAGVAVMLALVVTLGAQTASFEVASIKPSNPNPTGPLGARADVLPALGRLTTQNTTLRILVMAAYQKQPAKPGESTPCSFSGAPQQDTRSGRL